MRRVDCLDDTRQARSLVQADLAQRPVLPFRDRDQRGRTDVVGVFVELGEVLAGDVAELRGVLPGGQTRHGEHALCVGVRRHGRGVIVVSRSDEHHGRRQTVARLGVHDDSRDGSRAGRLRRDVGQRSEDETESRDHRRRDSAGDGRTVDEWRERHVLLRCGADRLGTRPSAAAGSCRYR
jgi:hypothetical protein